MMYFNRILFSDIDPFEVIQVKTDKLIIIREMKSELVNRKDVNDTFVSGGFLRYFDNSVQEWEITSSENSPHVKIRLHKNGKWKDRHGTKYVSSDTPIKRYDFNF